MAKTTTWQIPYPDMASPADIQGVDGIDDLAARLDVLFTQILGMAGIPGEVKMWSGAALPASKYGTWVWADGASYSATTYPDAAANIDPKWKTFAGAADPGAGFFRVPDVRGLIPVPLDQMPGGTRANRITRANAITSVTRDGVEYVTLTIAQIPAHDHGAATGAEAGHTHTFSTGYVSADHSHAITTGGASAGHVHYLGQDHGTVGGWQATGVVRGGDRGSGAYSQVTGGLDYNYMESTFHGGTLYNYSSGAHQDHSHSGQTGGISANHYHSGTTAAGSSHSHTVAAQGGGGSHDNLPPCVFVPYIVRLA